MKERVVISSIVLLAFVLAACTESYGPKGGGSRTPTPTGAENQPTASPSPSLASDVPDAKLTAVAAHTPVATVLASAACPVAVAQCDFLSGLDAALSRGDLQPLFDLLTLSMYTCPTFEEFLRHECEGRSGQQVWAFYMQWKLGMYLSLEDAEERIDDLYETATTRPGIAAVGCPVGSDCSERFGFVVRGQRAQEWPQVMVFWARPNGKGWLIDSAWYVIEGDSAKVLANGTERVGTFGSEVDFQFTRWEP